MHSPLRRLKRHPLWLLIGWLLVAVIIYLSLAEPPSMEMPAENADKYGHALAYATVMLWFMQLYPKTRTRALIGLGLLLLGIALEFLQGMTGFRSFEYADMLADAVGIVLGWI